MAPSPPAPAITAPATAITADRPMWPIPATMATATGSASASGMATAGGFAGSGFAAEPSIVFVMNMNVRGC